MRSNRVKPSIGLIIGKWRNGRAVRALDFRFKGQGIESRPCHFRFMKNSWLLLFQNVNNNNEKSITYLPSSFWSNPPWYSRALLEVMTSSLAVLYPFSAAVLSLSVHPKGINLYTAGKPIIWTSFWYLFYTIWPTFTNFRNADKKKRDQTIKYAPPQNEPNSYQIISSLNHSNRPYQIIFHSPLYSSKTAKKKARSWIQAFPPRLDSKTQTPVFEAWKAWLQAFFLQNLPDYE